MIETRVFFIHADKFSHWNEGEQLQELLNVGYEVVKEEINHGYLYIRLVRATAIEEDEVQDEHLHN